MSSTIPITTVVTSSTTGASTSVYGTTPGGTPRISYSRDQLLNLASSPLSRSPPKFDLPAAISRTPKVESGKFDTRAPPSSAGEVERDEEDAEADEAEAFSMDL